MIIAAVSGGVAAAAFAGAFVVYRGMPAPAARAKINKLFRDGELYIKKGNGKPTKAKTEIRLYPLVNRVSIYHDCMQIVFTIPDGMDPKKIINSLWLFKQGFGENIELIGQYKTFTLALYGADIKQFAYEPALLPAVDKYRLPIVTGKSRKGWEVYDMVDHPHLLIAGETGSGKSVALRSILTTLVDRCDHMELYCADLKRSEFHLFRGVAKQVVVDPNDLRTLMLKLTKELRRRGDLLDAAGVSHVDELRDAPPYVVLAIDEVALLKKEKDIMGAIDEMSAIGRALGMFLILSMQRPDADVLDGKLKNNLTVRMAFRHSDEINSRITIGSGEAAGIKQSQKGRCYLKGEELKQVQVPYLDVPSARKLLEPHKRPESVKGSRGAAIDVEFEVIEEEEDFLGVL